MCMYTYVCIYMWRAEVNFRSCPSLPPPFFFSDKAHWTWSSPYIADKPQGFTCPCLHSTEITDVHQLAWLFCVGSEGWPWGSLTCMVPSLLFCCCGKAPWPQFLIKERAYLGSWFQELQVHNVGQHEQGQKAENSHLEPEAWSRDSEPEVAGDF